MRLKSLTCDALARPVYFCSARSPQIVDVQLVERHLHKPEEIRGRLQQLIDEAEDQGYQAVVLAFGLCGQATAGLVARSIPLVLPRAHDCITLFLGSRQRYKAEVEQEPGTFWYSQDYLERKSENSGGLAMGATTDADTQLMYEKYILKYGRAKADRLMAVMSEWMTHYTRAVYLDLGFGDGSASEAEARSNAASHSWKYERIAVNLDLFQRLMNGQWDAADFLVVPPGQRVAMSYDDNIIESQEAA
jgi:hypothetical protein